MPVYTVDLKANVNRSFEQSLRSISKEASRVTAETNKTNEALKESGNARRLTGSAAKKAAAFSAILTKEARKNLKVVEAQVKSLRRYSTTAADLSPKINQITSGLDRLEKEHKQGVQATKQSVTWAASYVDVTQQLVATLDLESKSLITGKRARTEHIKRLANETEATDALANAKKALATARRRGAQTVTQQRASDKRFGRPADESIGAGIRSSRDIRALRRNVLGRPDAAEVAARAVTQRPTRIKSSQPTAVRQSVSNTNKLAIANQQLLKTTRALTPAKNKLVQAERSLAPVTASAIRATGFQAASNTRLLNATNKLVPVSNKVSAARKRAAQEIRRVTDIRKREAQQISRIAAPIKQIAAARGQEAQQISRVATPIKRIAAARGQEVQQISRVAAPIKQIAQSRSAESVALTRQVGALVANTNAQRQSTALVTRTVAVQKRARSQNEFLYGSVRRLTTAQKRLIQAQNAGRGAFRRFTRAAARGGGGLRTFNINIRNTTRNMLRLNTAARNSRGAFRSGHASALLFGGGILGLLYTIRRFASTTRRAVDDVTRFQNQIRLSTNTSIEFGVVQRGIIRISQQTGTSIASNAKVFQRFRNALSRYGKTAEEIIRITETMAKTVAAFGLGVQEARGAMIQLSQGLAAGQLRGQELLSVMEQLPPIAALIASELGVFTSDLRRLGEQGKITSEIVFKALAVGAEIADEKFKAFRFTLSAAAVTLRESFGLAAEKVLTITGGKDGLLVAIFKLRQFFTELSGATEKSAEAMDKVRRFAGFVTDAFRLLIATILVLIAIKLAVVLAGIIAALIAAGVATGGLAAGLGAVAAGTGVLAIKATALAVAGKFALQVTDALGASVRDLTKNLTAQNTASDAARSNTGKLRQEIEKFIARVEKGGARGVDLVIGAQRYLQILKDIELLEGANPANEAIRATLIAYNKRGEAIIAENKKQQEAIRVEAKRTLALFESGELEKKKIVQRSAAFINRIDSFRIKTGQSKALEEFRSQFKQFVDANNKDALREAKRRRDLQAILVRNFGILQDTSKLDKETALSFARQSTNLVEGERRRRGIVDFGQQYLTQSKAVETSIEEQNKKIKDQERLEQRLAGIRLDNARGLRALRSGELSEDEKIRIARSIASSTRAAQVDTQDFGFEEQNRQIAQGILDANKASKEAERAAVKAAREAERATKQAAKSAQQAAQAVGNSLVGAFNNVAQAADLFGERWASVARTIINEVGKLITRFVALRAAQQAAAAAGGDVSKAISGAGAINPQVAATTAGIAIVSAVLANVLSNDRETAGEKKVREAEIKAAEARAGAEQQAFQQRQEMISLERRQALAAEQALFHLDEQRKLAERAIAERDSANLRAFQAERESAFRRGANLLEATGTEGRTVPTIGIQKINIAIVKDESAADDFFNQESGKRILLDGMDGNQEDIRSILGIG